ncbi:3268_t:CDS:2 [Funneliformis caledonium]|uniref:3268_t:CDS:1 n=1 Tax=Funneliformis caledonium TaxID=1117310 RepID=A0A9N9CIV0_9GLOM|nr:3268_t:CDS:2 [Funneliformis caledonium]
MRLPNIAQVAIFTELVRKKLLVGLQNKEEHIRVKKTIHLKDSSIFDFMIRPSNDESEVIKSPLLDIPESEVKRFPMENNDIVGKTTEAEAEFKVVETLLKEAGIEGYNLSYPSDNFSDKFPLSRASPSQCPLCDRKHTTLDREKKFQSLMKKDQSRISNPNDHFVWWDLLCMCTLGKKFSRIEVYEAIQATVACVQGISKLWLIKRKYRQNRLYFDMRVELKLADFKIKIIKYGPDTDFFNLFLRFLAKPAPKINKEIMDPILWHTLNIISDGNVKLYEYLWDCLETISPLCYIRFRENSEHFNSAIQAQKLIVMNETGMFSGDWHRFNGHLKSLITEGIVTIERKGLESKRINDFAGYIITSNQDALIKIDIRDSRIVCYDISLCCRDNTAYFKRLRNVFNHPDASGVVMKYLLSRDISDFEPQEIPATKMKSDIMRDQLSTSIRFIINYISSWCEDKVAKPRKKFSLIGIDQTRSRENRVRVYQYILDCSKIVTKLCESDLDDIKEFSNIPQPEALMADEFLANKTTDIPIFNVPEIIPPKIIPPHPEKNTPSPSISKDKKGDKQDDSTQTLFDYVVEKTEAPVTSTSRTSETIKASELSEPVIDKSETSKPSKPIERISNMLKQEERLRKWAIDYGEDPDKFMMIIEKDVNLSRMYQDRMIADTEVIEFARENNINPNDLFYMTRRKRLISEKIYLWEFEDVEKP